MKLRKATKAIKGGIDDFYEKFRELTDEELERIYGGVEIRPAMEEADHASGSDAFASGSDAFASDPGVTASSGSVSAATVTNSNPDFS